MGIGLAFLGRVVDPLFDFSAIAFPLAKEVALLLLGLGFVLRLGASMLRKPD